MRPAAKQCSRCREVKPAHEFYPHPKTSTGLTPRCKLCNALEYAGVMPEYEQARVKDMLSDLEAEVFKRGDVFAVYKQGEDTIATLRRCIKEVMRRKGIVYFADWDNKRQRLLVTVEIVK